MNSIQCVQITQWKVGKALKRINKKATNNFPRTSYHRLDILALTNKLKDKFYGIINNSWISLTIGSQTSLSEDTLLSPPSKDYSPYSPRI